MFCIFCNDYFLFLLLVSSSSGFVAVSSTFSSQAEQATIFRVRKVPSILRCPKLSNLVAPYSSLLKMMGLERNEIDLQSDTSMYGRGVMHLSASLDEGDVVAYQIGTWTVDGVEVGDGTPAAIRYARVENIQIVWTHNCEHGVVRGVLLEVDENKPQGFVLTGEQIEFGPEQLVARLVVEWDETEKKATAVAPFEESSLLTY